MFGVLALLIVIMAVVLLVEARRAAGGQREDFRNPDHAPRSFGTGTPLTYVVIGDSTAAGQGAGYADGIAVNTAQHLAAGHAVRLYNLGISGATTADVRDQELAEAAALKPDVVLLAVGANDVTQLTSEGKVKEGLDKIIDGLVAANCNVKIVLTGSPDIGGARRLAQPLRWITGERTKAINNRVAGVVAQRGLTMAPIAKETGPLFRADASLLAADRFHPNAKGYATWMSVLNRALDEAMQNQPSHCEAVSD